jgi:hypothetical protein
MGGADKLLPRLVLALDPLVFDPELDPELATEETEPPENAASASAFVGNDLYLAPANLITCF